MVRLQDQISRELDQWQQDLTPQWRAFFGDAAPDLAAFSADFTYDAAFPVIPPRRRNPLEGAPAGAHIFRAFDGLAPEAVRVVIIGQDPYPNKARATGRAFEDGALTDWGGTVAVSLKSLVQSALALRIGEPGLAADRAAWAVIRERIRRGEIVLQPIGAWFDRLQHEEGVLFVNAGWTLTRFEPGGSEEQKAHIAMWRPLMTRLLTGLAAHEQPVVFVLLGNFAQSLFAASGVEAAARAAGHWGDRVEKVAHPHPNAPGYFAAGNPLLIVNDRLAAMRSNPIVW